MRYFLAAMLALGSASLAGAQQVYKWVDKDGTVHFADSPPPETIEAERMVLRGNVQSPVTDAQPQRGMTSDEVDLLYTPEQRQTACEQARANRTTLTNMAIITVDRNSDGVVEELTEEEKAAELRRADEQIELLCIEDDAG